MLKQLSLFLLLWVCGHSLLQAQIKLKIQPSDTLGDDSISIAIVHDFIQYENPKTCFGGALDEVRFKEDSVEQARLIEVGYRNKKLKLYLEPGDSILLRFKTGLLFETAEFYGQGAMKCRYMLARQNRFDNNIEFNLVPHKMKSLNTKAYRDLVEINRDLRLNFLEHFEEDNFLPRSFKKYIEREIQYQYWKELLQYPYLHPFLAGLDSFKVGPKYFDFLKKVDLTAGHNMVANSYEYTNFLKAYYTHLAQQKNWLKGHDPDYFKLYDQAKDELKNSKLKRFVMAWCLFSASPRHSGESYFQYYLDFFSTFSERHTYHNQLEERVNEFYRLKEGKAAPDFMLLDTAGNVVSLADFRKKHVYIDFWASWCMPCIRQFPYADSLAKKYSEEDLMFIYINMDTKESQWKNALKGHKSHGVHLFAGGFNTQIAKDYGISSLPKYFLIDPYGIFIETDAPRPSDPALENRLDFLLSNR